LLRVGGDNNIMPDITREELYKSFGPVLLEAIVLIIKEDINLLRVEHGLPERTNEQIMNAIKLKLDALSVYDWMNESF